MNVIERKRILITNTLREILCSLHNEYSVFKDVVITVTNTYLLDGGKLIKVYLSLYSYNGRDIDEDRFLKFLRKISGKIRFKLGLSLSNKLKFIPSIDFYIDDTMKVFNSVKELMNRINS